jgi:hypothetical protein
MDFKKILSFLSKNGLLLVVLKFFSTCFILVKAWSSYKFLCFLLLYLEYLIDCLFSDEPR